MTHTCTNCGRVVNSQYGPERIHARCKATGGKCEFVKPEEANPLPIGRWVKAGLSAVGITPERVEQATGKPCGCKERAAKMDRWGARVWRKAKSLFGQ